MKNRYLYLALLASTGVVASLSACGEGLPFNLEDTPEMQAITAATDDVTGFRIPGCSVGIVPSGNCATDIQKPLPSSSSQAEPPPISSSVSEPSSSSVAPSSSSVESSSSEEPSSSSVAPSSSSVAPSSSSVAPSSSSVAPSSSSVAPSSSSVAPSSSSVAQSSSSVAPSSSSVAPSSSSVAPPPPSSSSVVVTPPSGTVGGSIDTPITTAGNNVVLDVTSTGGIIYLSGKDRQNHRKIKCDKGMTTVESIMTCDFRNGECTPGDKCGGPFNSGNGECQFPGSYFINTTSDQNYCNNNDCEYKIKIQFILKSGQTTYPWDCTKSS